jgi:hypothetical protein
VAGASVLAVGAAALVGGTYAKYTTSDNKGDKAQVAKFGVVVKAKGDLFGETYKSSAFEDGTANNPAASTEAAVTVVSSGGYDVVAPGTRNDEGLTFSFSGQPEVAVTVTTAVSDGWKDVFLAEGNYPDVTAAPKDDGTYDSSTHYQKYNPVKYTLAWTHGTGEAATTEKLVNAGSLEQLVNYVNVGLAVALNGAITAAGGVTSHVDLATVLGTLALTWEWGFAEDNTDASKADTLLGALAAGLSGVTVDAGNYNLNPEIEITVTVAQVD